MYLQHVSVLLKDFGRHVEEVSSQVKAAALSWASESGRPIQYLASSQVSKEDMARAIAQRDGVSEGPVCVLTCVEPCRTFDICRNRETKQLDLVVRPRKCLFVYHYFIHPELGWGYVRLQTWFPFHVQVGLNGRTWLARQMDTAGLGYLKSDNCFPWVADFSRAQALLDEQLTVNWSGLLDGFADQIFPVRESIFARHRVSYYWSVFQSEWATDVVFADRDTLRVLYPRWVHHGLTTLHSVDTMRFLGRTVSVQNGRVPVRFAGEVVSDVKRREEGVRLKHRMDKNSVKLYDKAYTSRGSVVRVETTLNDSSPFRVFRAKEGAPEEQKTWQTLRAGVADLARRAQVSQAANARYLGALTQVDDGTALGRLLERVQRPITRHGRRTRALHPFENPDAALLNAVSHGQFLLNGFRNHDLQTLLFLGVPRDAAEARHRSAQVSRALARLRAHGLIKKVPHEYRYHLTASGRTLAAAISAAKAASVSALVDKAA
ncbi:MAG: hypothetical protein HZB26_02815 [Candidatus Hydrogenedentes bacterium]|nr:hypothetical protein [Candidatus Hydrogenedentota bacterium]